MCLYTKGEQEEDCDHEPEIRTVNHYWFTGWPDFGTDFTVLLLNSSFDAVLYRNSTRNWPCSRLPGYYPERSDSSFRSSSCSLQVSGYIHPTGCS